MSKMPSEVLLGEYFGWGNRRQFQPAFGIIAVAFRFLSFFGTSDDTDEFVMAQKAVFIFHEPDIKLIVLFPSAKEKRGDRILL